MILLQLGVRLRCGDQGGSEQFGVYSLVQLAEQFNN